jgi:plastocyanin
MVMLLHQTGSAFESRAFSSQQAVKDGSAAVASTVPVSITETAFDPDIVTITVGNAVEWTNRTSAIQQIVAEPDYLVFLPLLVRNLTYAAVTTSDPDIGETAAKAPSVRASDWGSGPLAPGETFSHTFTIVGNYPYYLAADPQVKGTVHVQEAPAYFSIGVEPSARVIAQGGSVTYTVSVSGIETFSAPVTLSVSGLPSDAAPGWSANPVTPPGLSTLTVNTTGDTPTGTHALVISGIGGGQEHATDASLTVNPFVGADFELGVRPLSSEVTQGLSVVYTVAVTTLHGFEDTVSLSLGGVPTHTTYTWEANPVVPNAESSLTITPSLLSPTGTYTLAVTGTGGGRVHSASFGMSIRRSDCPQTGPWFGITDQGYPISFTVSNDGGCHLDGGLKIQIETSCDIRIPGIDWDISIENHSFDTGIPDPEVIGHFTSSTEVTGTWDFFAPRPFPPGTCRGSGTWSADYGPPLLTKHVITDSFGGAVEVSAIDVDGDLDMDILGAASSDDTIAWWENDGNEQFGQHVITNTFAGACSIYAADLDRDTDVDIVAAAEDDDTIAWWENDGGENFSSHVISDTFGNAQSVYATDVDGDQEIDILGAAYDDDAIIWWKNDGSENFTPHVITDTFDGAQAVFATDLDDDMDVDILGVAYLADTITWWENDGSGNFTGHTITSTYTRAHSVYATDVDSDGDVDILGAAFTARRIVWWENDGNENFTLHTIADGVFGGRSVYATDMDGDNEVDVLGAAFWDGLVTWWKNDGNENFTVYGQGIFFSHAYDVYAADVDGDSDMDMLGASQRDDEIAWWEQPD